MFSEPRQISNDDRPEISLCTFLLITGEETVFCPKLCKQDVYTMLDTHLPNVRAGKTRLFIAWQGQWRTDIFEVTPDTVNVLKKELIAYGKREFTTFKL